MTAIEVPMPWLPSLFALLGCSDRGPTEPQSVTVDVRAAEGARLVLDADEALIIPPGGLDRDARVTFERRRCDGVYASPYFAGCAYEVHSDAALTDRYTVSFPLDGAGHVVGRERDVWRALLDSTLVGEHASATRSTWSALSIQAVAPPSCVDPPFTPCGGDVEGTWRVDAACIEPADLGIGFSGGADPYAACGPDEALVEQHAIREGSVTFEASGQWSEMGNEALREITITTASCDLDVGIPCGPDCTDDGDTCTCDRVIAEQGGVTGGTWAVVDATTLDILGGMVPYCVEGDSLTLAYGGQRFMRYVR